MNPLYVADAPSMRLVARSLAKPNALPRGLVHVAPADIETVDWNDLFNAVKDRLRSTVAEPDSLASNAHRVRASVLECVQALDQLHATLSHEFERSQQLEVDVRSAQAALAQAHAELIGTQAGEQRARHMAMHDSLTSLPNRTCFFERLDHALAIAPSQQQPLALLYLDLDGFKRINDEHGHDAGDELLRIVAARLSRTVRAGDLVSRLGGDEFSCLLTDVRSREQLAQLAGKLLDAVSAPLQMGALKFSVRASIGIAVCPTDGKSSEALLKSADAAMYQAKRQRSGHAFFDAGAELSRAAMNGSAAR